MGMTSFYAVFPKLAETEVRTVTIPPGSDLGTPAGIYGFGESYCDEPGCDCRRVMISIVSKRTSSSVAHINMGFDADGEMAGPCLDPLNRQGPSAAALLWFFTEMINRDARLSGARATPLCAFQGACGSAAVPRSGLCEARRGQARRPVAAAQQAAGEVGPKEQALIEALTARYSADPDADRDQLNRAYADAMAEVAERYGELEPARAQQQAIAAIADKIDFSGMVAGGVPAP